MRKKRAISLILITVISIMCFGTTATFAQTSTNIVVTHSSNDPVSQTITDDGEYFDTKWDFEDFTWQTTNVSGEAQPSISEPVWWTTSQYTSANTEVISIDGNNALKIDTTKNNNLKLLFGEVIKEGTLHTTFYMRKDNTALDLQLGFVTGFYDNIATSTVQNRDVAALFQIKDWFKIRHTNVSKNDGWQTGGFDLQQTFNKDQWYRIDLVVTDNASASTEGIKVYVDGGYLNSTSKIKTYSFAANVNGTKTTRNGVGIAGLGIFGWAASGGTNFYLDDVRVRRYDGNRGLTLETATTNISDSLDITLTDLVEARYLTKENIIVTKDDGTEIENFEVSEVEGTYDKDFTLTFDTPLTAGSYSVDIDDSVKGRATEDSATALTFDVAEPVPAVTAVKYYDYKNDEVTNNSSLIKKAEITFNCLVDEASALDKISVDGVDNEEVAFTTVGGVSKATITFPELLKPSTAYTLTVEAGVINNAEADKVSEDVYTDSFTTLNDAAFLKIEQTIENGKHKVTFVKNTDDAYNLYVIAGKYEDEVLKDVSFMPITIEATEKGEITRDEDVAFIDNGDVKYFIWTQAGLAPVF